MKDSPLNLACYVAYPIRWCYVQLARLIFGPPGVGEFIMRDTDGNIVLSKRSFDWSPPVGNDLESAA